MVASASERSERGENLAFLRQNHIILVNSLLVYHTIGHTTSAYVPNTHDIGLIIKV